MKSSLIGLRNPVAGRFLNWVGRSCRVLLFILQRTATGPPVPCGDGTAPRPCGARGGTSGDGIGDKHGPSSWLDLMVEIMKFAIYMMTVHLKCEE